MDKIESRRPAVQCLDGYILLQSLYNEDLSPSETAEIIQTLLPPVDDRLRSVAQPGLGLLPSDSNASRRAPSLQQVIKAFNARQKDVNAIRKGRASQGLPGRAGLGIEPLAVKKQDGKQIGNADERYQLAMFAKDMAEAKLAQPRDGIANMLAKLLQARQLISPKEPLNKAEVAFLKRIAEHGPSTDSLTTAWYVSWETEQCMAAPKEAQLMSDKRAAHYTTGAAERHFERLDAALDKHGFLLKTGPNKGHIKRDRKQVVRGRLVHSLP